MNKETIQQIIKSNDVLLETTTILATTSSRLVDNNTQAINLAQLSNQQREKLMRICVEIYQGLSDKEKRNLAEESWHKGLHQALRTQ